ncbi:MAG: HDIG domain-containing protein [Anaerolineaceae bacterium]|nr:HDIG domain-containing protein [Anaerolineaceae bacterium]
MVERLANLLSRSLHIPATRTRRWLNIAGVTGASLLFLLVATVLVAFDNIFDSTGDIAGLTVGDTAPRDIRAPIALPPYVSKVLTEQRQQEISDSVPEVYLQPDASVSRRQTDLSRQILDYIKNIQRDPFATLDQKIHDIQAITDLTLSETIIERILNTDPDEWTEMDAQIVNVLERAMRGEIRESNLPGIIAQLPTQVSVRFTPDESEVIVAIVEDLLRPNTQLNVEATEAARDAAIAGVEVRRGFERGQIVVSAGSTIDAAAYEALGKLGLLEPSERRLQEVTRALLTSIVVMVLAGLYISRFRPTLFHSTQTLSILAGIFLLVLFGARLVALQGQIYLYPTAVLALLFVALVGLDMAVIGVVLLGILLGLTQVNSLEVVTLVITGGLMAALTMRRSERLNSYFLPGLSVALMNTVIVTIFFQGTANSQNLELSELVLYSIINGLLVSAVSLAGLYVVTFLFNLPTMLKLIELSQPGQPLLQRLLREAPGTYQHSLMVANLSEQAANAIGADSALVRVAALYHDIGKMLNAPFFTENQADGVNPHEVLNDPARSADIIISHVTDGEKLARQYRLPARFRDFILEHHGTRVMYFYDLAVARAGSEDAVDISEYQYPGPRPRSRETAILMLADSCEAAVRARKPSKNQEIIDTVNSIFEDKLQTGQLDDSGLTLNNLKDIKRVITEMLQAVFHPRISYPVTPRPPKTEPKVEAVPLKEKTGEIAPAPPPPTIPKVEKTVTTEMPVVKTMPPITPTPSQQTGEAAAVSETVKEEAPLPEVPRLPRSGEHKAVKPESDSSTNSSNGLPEGKNRDVPDRHS